MRLRSSRFFAVIVLFVFSAQTGDLLRLDDPTPVTAAFLGAAYGGGCVLVALSIRTGAWINARLPLLTILLFAVLTLIATLLHIDRFHFSAPGAIAQFAAWFWLIVYIAVPIALAVVLIAQERMPGGHPPRRLPLPRWVAAMLLIQGSILLIAGVVLYVWPTGELHLAVAADAAHGPCDRSVADLVRRRGSPGAARELHDPPADLLARLRRLRAARADCSAAIRWRPALG